MLKLTSSFPFVRRQTVDDITAPLQKTMTKLNSHAASNDASADRHQAKIDARKIKRDVNQREASKARQMVNKIAGIVS